MSEWRRGMCADLVYRLERSCWLMGDCLSTCSKHFWQGCELLVSSATRYTSMILVSTGWHVQESVHRV